MQKRLPLARILVFNSHRQRLPCPHKNGKPFRPGQAGINEVPEEHFEVLG
jgi:hypothetical protein